VANANEGGLVRSFVVVGLVEFSVPLGTLPLAQNLTEIAQDRSRSICLLPRGASLSLHVRPEETVHD